MRLQALARRSITDGPKTVAQTLWQRRSAAGRLARSRVPLGVRYMLIATAAFALMNVAVKFAGRLPAHELVFFRVLGMGTLTVIGLWRVGVWPFAGSLKWLLVRGAAGAMALLLYFITLRHMPLHTAVALQYLAPLFAALLAPWFIGERMAPVRWLYFLISFAGVVALRGFEEGVDLFYLSLGVLSALLTGLSTNAIRRARHTEHPLVVMLYLPMFALPGSAAFTVWDWVPPVGWEWVALIAMIVLAQTTQYYNTRALQADTLERVTYVNYLGLLYAVGLGYLIFGEPLTLGGFGGMILILAGVGLNLLDGQRQRPAAKDAPPSA